MTKQAALEAVAANQAVAQNSTPQNLFVSVRTFDAQGKTIGERIVDMCHYGTRNWLSNHLWWSTHNGHCVEIDLAKPEEITSYLKAGTEALAAKFNGDATETVVEKVAA